MAGTFNKNIYVLKIEGTPITSHFSEAADHVLIKVGEGNANRPFDLIKKYENHGVTVTKIYERNVVISNTHWINDTRIRNRLLSKYKKFMSKADPAFLRGVFGITPNDKDNDGLTECLWVEKSHNIDDVINESFDFFKNHLNMAIPLSSKITNESAEPTHLVTYKLMDMALKNASINYRRLDHQVNNSELFVGQFDRDYLLGLVNQNNVYNISDDEENYKKYFINNNDALEKKMTFLENENGWVEELNSKDMKFDLIFANPPYTRGTLELDIMEQMPSLLKDEDSEAIVIAPIRWLQDPFKDKKGNRAAYGKHQELLKYIADIYVPNKCDMENEFKIGVTSDIGIYRINSKGGFDFSFFEKSILRKIYDKLNVETNNLKNIITDSDMNTFNVRIPGFMGGSGERVSLGLMYSDLIFINGLNSQGLTYQQDRDSKAWGSVKKGKTNCPNIEFNSKNELDNFYNSYNTYVLRYYFMEHSSDVHVQWQFLPWLGNITNPRTNKVGYLSDWTDDDLIQVCGLSQDEFEEIKERVIFEETKAEELGLA